ncbi:MAG: Na+/H+ antiporter NhaC family protein [Acidaminococcaceae bacterium]|nr:Na+/H+ antiporter NhaC family protein [Acidaminococcaceae bacterium]
MKKGSAAALLPILVFVVFYLGLGIWYEYIMKIPMGFYNIPIVVAFLLSILVASLQNRNTFDDQLDLMANGLRDRNIITMIMIFLAAGIFVGVVGRSSANSVAYFILSLLPAEYSVVALFVISCFVSLAMGTSCGTITLVTPIAVSLANASGFSVPLCLATVMGGAMFGDNLSFISDTTIAACNGQGCHMQDKFKENFAIALPATILSLVLIQVMSGAEHIQTATTGYQYDLVKIIPYLFVLAGGIAGLNVFLVLLGGVLVGAFVMLVTGDLTFVKMLGNMGTGASGMFETSMVAILVPVMCALIKDSGGFDAILYFIQSCFKGNKGGKVGIGLLVSLLDIATANNTVAIVVANPIAKEMAEHYKVTPRETASILDIFSCVMQGVIPYGAQMLILLGAAQTMGVVVSPLSVMQYLYYPYLLLLSVLVYIFVRKN